MNHFYQNDEEKDWRREINHYFSAKRAPEKTNILKRMKHHENDYPTLAIIIIY